MDLQGITPREELPPSLVEWAEREMGDAVHLEYMTWWADEPDILIFDFGDAGSLRARVKAPLP